MRIQQNQDWLSMLGESTAAAGENRGTDGLFAQLLQTMPTISHAVDGEPLPPMPVTTQVEASAASAAVLSDGRMATIDTAAFENTDATIEPGSVAPAVASEIASAASPVPEALAAATAAPNAGKIKVAVVTPVLSPEFKAPVKPAMTATVAVDDVVGADTATGAAATVEQAGSPPARKPATIGFADSAAATVAEPVQSSTSADTGTTQPDPLMTSAAAGDAAPANIARETADFVVAAAGNEHGSNASVNAGANQLSPVMVARTTTAQLPINHGSNASDISPRPAASLADRTGKATQTTSAAGNRGAVLPAGGNELPPVTAAGFALPGTPALAVDSADAAYMQGAVNTAAQHNAPSPHVTGAAPSQWSLNAPTTDAAVADAARNSDFIDQSLPPALTSTFVMGSAAWGEETVQQLRWLKEDDQQSAQLQLHPAELGRLDISIEIKDGQTSVQLIAGNADARELLERSLPALREMLSQHGMTLADSQVSQERGQRMHGNFQSSLPFSLEDEPPPDNALLQRALRQGRSNHRIDYYV